MPAIVTITAPEEPGIMPGLGQAIAILQVFAGKEVPPEILPSPEFLDGRPLGFHDAIVILQHIAGGSPPMEGQW